MSSRITKAKAQKIAKTVAKMYGVEPEHGPTLVKDFDWRGTGTQNWALVWEEGPFEWTLAASWKVDVEGVFAEPITSWALGLYPA